MTRKNGMSQKKFPLTGHQCRVAAYESRHPPISPLLQTAPPIYGELVEPRVLVIEAGDLWRGGGESDNVQEEDTQKVSKRLLQ